AQTYARQDRMDQAVKEAELAVKTVSDLDRLRVLLFQVRILTQAGKYAQAEAQCLDMLKEYHLTGDIIDIRFHLSQVYSAQKDHARAEEQLAMILEMDPNNATANNDLGYT